MNSAKANCGYYFARYEASKGTDGKVKSKGNVKPWVYLEQRDASTYSRAMYTSDAFSSDLLNSNTWDTTIMFIQKYSEEKTYSNNYKRYSELDVTGERNGTTDKVCNIYDMATNCQEFDTECGGGNSYPIARGACYDASSATKAKSRTVMSGEYMTLGFRTILYIE